MKPNTLNGVLAQVLLSGAAQPAAHEEVAKMLRETALEGDFGDDGKPVVVVDTSFEHHDELQATLTAAGREERVVIVGAGYGGRTRTVHKTSGVGLSAGVAAAYIASMQSISSKSSTGTTGRAMSKRYSDMCKEDNRRRAELASLRPRQATMSRNFAAPYGAQTQHDLERIAAAEAKRARKAAKKVKL